MKFVRAMHNVGLKYREFRRRTLPLWRTSRVFAILNKCAGVGADNELALAAGRVSSMRRVFGLAVLVLKKIGAL